MILPFPLILASSSPRRQYLLKEAGFTFSVQKLDIEESFPQDLPAVEVASYLAQKKASFFKSVENNIVLTADTVVIVHNKILNKPKDRAEAASMLELLSNNTHLVITGVCIRSPREEKVFYDTTEVTFQPLTSSEINYYIDHYKPFDKAGAYGAQDWIGMVAIKKIVGSYFNVMGLPIHQVYKELKAYSR